MYLNLNLGSPDITVPLVFMESARTHFTFPRAVPVLNYIMKTAQFYFCISTYVFCCLIGSHVGFCSQKFRFFVISL